jgi:hypothetical protein
VDIGWLRFDTIGIYRLRSLSTLISLVGASSDLIWKRRPAEWSDDVSFHYVTTGDEEPLLRSAARTDVLRQPHG